MEAPVKTEPVEQPVAALEQPEQPAEPPKQAEPPAEQPAEPPAERPKKPRAKRVAKDSVAAPAPTAPPPTPELYPSDIRFWGGLLAEHQARQRAARISKYSSLFKM
jgi:hypothetical protein